MMGVLITAACSIEPRSIDIVDGAAGASEQDGTSVMRDASQKANDARAGSGGAGGIGGAGGGSDASIDGNAGMGGSSGGAGGTAGATGSGGAAGAGGGGAGSGGAAGATGPGGTAGATGSGGAAGAGASGGIGGTGGAAGNAGNASGAGGVAGIAGAGGVAGIAGTGGVAGIAGAGGAGTTGGSGGVAGSGTGGTTGGSGGFDAGTGGTAGQTGTDASDVRFVDANRVDAPTGSTVVLFVEEFDNQFGSFTIVNGCGSPPDWIHFDDVDSYVQAEAPATKGVSSIVSPTIPIPANVSNVRLRMRHQVVTQEGNDGTQVLISRTGQAPMVVESFTPNGYENGISVNPDSCVEGTVGQYPGWSGDLQLGETEANLSAAPLNVGPGDTVSIQLRMAVDSGTAGGGWDVYWVRLTGTVQ